MSSPPIWKTPAWAALQAHAKFIEGTHLRELLADLMRQQGLKTLQAGDGHEALAQLRLHPALQLLLSDVQMPGMTG